MGLLSVQNQQDFRRDGFVVVNDLLSIQDVITPVQDEYTTFSPLH